jgi:hypothetical protein
MKTKKRIFGVSVVLCVASLLVSLCLLCFSGSQLIANAEEATISTVDSVVDETVPTSEEQPETTPKTDEETAADKANNSIKNWIGIIFGAGSTVLDTILLAVLSRKKKESVTVTVNDAETQKKLETIQADYANMQKIMVDVFQLQKGTFEVLKTIFAENSSLDAKVRDTIKQISLHEEDIVKDFQDIFDSENHKKAKTALKNISNIILG